MKVVYSHEIFTKQVYGGISRYFVELARNLPIRVRYKIFSGLHINAYLKSVNYIGIKVPNVIYTQKLRDVISRLAEQVYISATNPDIYHKTYYGVQLVKRCRRHVLTVYDMIHERYPDYYSDSASLSALKRNDCEQADHIIAISNSTRSDLINFFSIPPEKISVVYLAPSEFGSNKTTSLLLQKKKPFILFVGQRDGYKNFISLLKAYGTSTKTKSEFNLVCFGGGPVRLDESILLKSLNLEKKVKFVSGSDTELRAYYESARLLVYPSLYEGFGLPILEAMQSRCPVLCYAKGSIPEVAAKAASFITGDLSTVIEQLIFDDVALNRLKELGKIRASQFNWSRCSEETAKIYKSIL